MERGRRDDGVGSVVSLIIAGSVFMAAIGTVLYTVQQTGSDDDVSMTVQRAEAELLMRMLLESEGQGDILDPDNITRVGLKSANGGIALSKMEVMRGAQISASTNSIVDYEEARTSLAMDQDDRGYTTEFHLRIFPVADASGINALDLSDLRTAYVGDWVNLVTVTVPLSADLAMVRDADAEINSTIDNGTMSERSILAGLGLGFDNNVHMTTGYPDVLVEIAPLVTVPLHTVGNATIMEGDVYPDDAAYLENSLKARLSEYDVLVIGSGADHAALDGSINQTIADWVSDGGALVVFGSDEGDDDWLAALLATSVESANGAAYATDATHPILKTPNTVAWDTWPAPEQSWSIPQTGSNPYAEFSHVLTDSAGTLLAVSDEDAFGSGRIFLLGHEVRDIESTLSTAEATALVENIVTYIDNEEMYLDFGATVPTDGNVATAVRHTFLEDDDFGQVPVRVEILIWRE